MTLTITSAHHDADLFDLPWVEPLESWPKHHLAALPRGISRHVVRFVRLGPRVIAIKEIRAELAEREFGILRTLGRLDLPCVEPYAVVSGRTTTGRSTRKRSGRTPPLDWSTRWLSCS